MSENFRDAEINQEAQEAPAQDFTMSEPSLTTDDLVIMIGEAAIEKRQSTKIINEHRTMLARAMSQLRTLEVAEAEKDSLLASRESLNQRVISLEDQVHKTALERDEARNDLSEMTTRVVRSEELCERLQERVQELTQANAALKAQNKGLYEEAEKLKAAKKEKPKAKKG